MSHKRLMCAPSRTHFTTFSLLSLISSPTLSLSFSLFRPIHLSGSHTFRQPATSFIVVHVQCSARQPLRDKSARVRSCAVECTIVAASAATGLLGHARDTFVVKCQPSAHFRRAALSRASSLHFRSVNAASKLAARHNLNLNLSLSATRANVF